MKAEGEQKKLLVYLTVSSYLNRLSWQFDQVQFLFLLDIS